MANDKTWLNALLVVEDDNWFTRSKSGAIWGTVYFQIGDKQFSRRMDGPTLWRL
jgi:hypothetical protein